MIMNVYVNHHIFTQTTVDSGALTQLGVVVRQFPRPGDYLGTIFHREQPVGRFYLSIDKSCPATQVNIDLATVGRDAGAEGCSGGVPAAGFVVGPEGYVVLHVSHGAGGFAAAVAALGESREREAESFDSRALTAGDLFGVTLIRPGTYQVTNLDTEATAEIVVAYPRVGDQPFRPADPVAVQCTDSGFEPSSIQIEAAQGQVYQVQTSRPSRIRVELVEPDDGSPRG
jgi:hypothetical protein